MDAAFTRLLLAQNAGDFGVFPDKRKAEEYIGSMFHFLFSSGRTEAGLTAHYSSLREDLYPLLSECADDKQLQQQCGAEFFDSLPGIYQLLLEDATAILEFDPAARNLAEVIIAYPGFFATVIYRLSHQLWKQGLRLLPRLFSEHAHSKTGIDIHPGATIGRGFAIDHGTGIVIGETTVVGDNVKIYQGVTLGALNVDKANAQQKRHPTIEDNVVIYSGATILGGNTVVGRGSIIGGNVWLTQSVPPGCVVYHKSEIRIRDKEPFSEPLNFII